MEFSPRSAYEVAKEIGHSLFLLGRTAVINVMDKIDDAMDVFGDNDEN